MPVRDFIGLLLWLCVAVFVHLDVPFAAADATVQDLPVQTVPPVPADKPDPSHDGVGAKSGVQASGPAVTVPEAAQQTLKALEARHGNPLPGYVGGRTFRNREHALPRGRYREYDVHPKVPGKNRGPERIVIEQRTGKAFYTADHYRSFIPMN